MRAQIRPRLLATPSLFIALAIALPLAFVTLQTPLVKAAQTHMTLSCAHSALCTELQDPEEAFGEGNYVGHDEPATLFYSNKAGSGNKMTYVLKLPTDPKPGLQRS